jgi:uncharacterized membrane-anchored protein YhcB (DUF1043 family)
MKKYYVIQIRPTKNRFWTNNQYVFADLEKAKDQIKKYRDQFKDHELRIIEIVETPINF